MMVCVGINFLHAYSHNFHINHDDNKVLKKNSKKLFLVGELLSELSWIRWMDITLNVVEWVIVIKK